MNRKGIVPIVALMWIVGILTVGVVTWFTGPSIVKAVKGENTNQSRQTLKESESYPIGHLDQKGNFIKIGDYKKSTDTLNFVNQVPPETLWQKFWHITWMVIIVFVGLGALLVYVFGWPKVKGWIDAERAKAQAAQQATADLTYDAKCIVVSVKAGLATLTDPVVKKGFMDAMSKEQDQSTEDLVKELLKGT